MVFLLCRCLNDFMICVLRILGMLPPSSSKVQAMRLVLLVPNIRRLTLRAATVSLFRPKYPQVVGQVGDTSLCYTSCDTRIVDYSSSGCGACPWQVGRHWHWPMSAFAVVLIVNSLGQVGREPT